MHEAVEVMYKHDDLMFLETLLAFAEKADKQEILEHLRQLIDELKQSK